VFRFASHIGILLITIGGILAKPGEASAQVDGDAGSVVKLSVTLSGSVADMQGVKVHSDSSGDGRADVLEPQQITLRFLDGTSLNLTARSSSTLWYNRSVDAVFLRKPMQPVTFMQAKADLLRTLASMHIEPDWRLKHEMSFWPEDSTPGNYSYETGITGPFHGTGVGIRVSPDPPAGWYYLLVFTALGPDSVAVMAPATQPSSPPSATLNDISINLPEMADQVKGADVQITGRGTEEADLLEPQRLTLHAADGSTIHAIARSLNLMSFGGVIRGVYVRRPMQAVSFNEAKADMLRTLADMDIKPDRVMNMLMSQWPANGPTLAESHMDCQTGMTTHGMELTIRLCPEPAGGWYYMLIFADTNNTTLPATQPAASSASSRN
jgi:hypothetical protein